LWIITKDEHVSLRPAADGFITILPKPERLSEVCNIRIRHSVEWETAYWYWGKELIGKRQFCRQQDIIGRLSNRTVAFSLLLNGSPVDPLPYLPQLRPFQVTSPSSKMSAEEARMILRAAANIPRPHTQT
jgi:hypothetical protein